MSTKKKSVSSTCQEEDAHGGIPGPQSFDGRQHDKVHKSSLERKRSRPHLLFSGMVCTDFRVDIYIVCVRE